MKTLLYIDLIICNFWPGTKLVDMLTRIHIGEMH